MDHFVRILGESGFSLVLFGLILVFLFTLSFPPGAGRAPVPGPVVGAVGSRELAGARRR